MASLGQTQFSLVATVWGTYRSGTSLGPVRGTTLGQVGGQSGVGLWGQAGSVLSGASLGLVWGGAPLGPVWGPSLHLGGACHYWRRDHFDETIPGGAAGGAAGGTTGGTAATGEGTTGGATLGDPASLMKVVRRHDTLAPSNE